MKAKIVKLIKILIMPFVAWLGYERVLGQVRRAFRRLEKVRIQIKVGSIVDLVYIRGHGHGKVVAMYQNWAMVIHPCLPNPTAIHISKLELV